MFKLDLPGEWTLNFVSLSDYKKILPLPGSHIIAKMSSVMPFTFNAVELCMVTTNERPWTSAKEVCRALKYGKATKSANIVKHLYSKENYTQKCQLIRFVPETKPVN